MYSSNLLDSAFCSLLLSKSQSTVNEDCLQQLRGLLFSEKGLRNTKGALYLGRITVVNTNKAALNQHCNLTQINGWLSRQSANNH